VVFLRHASERDRLSNTGHWAALALAGSAVVEQGVPNAPLDTAGLAGPGTWLLYPSPHPPPAGSGPPRRLVVPDGTWPQARRMVQRVPQLWALPRLSLPSPAVVPRLRRPLAGGMSTLEAVAAALRSLGEESAAAGLETLLADGVALATRLRGTPERLDSGPRTGSRRAAGARGG
jgi:DTW domain-containing protein